MKINIIYSLFFLLLTFSCRWDKADGHYVSITEYCNKYAGDKLMKVDIKEVEYDGKMYKRHREGIYDYELNGDYTLKEFFLENGKRILDKLKKIVRIAGCIYLIVTVKIPPFITLSGIMMQKKQYTKSE